MRPQCDCKIVLQSITRRSHTRLGRPILQSGTIVQVSAGMRVTIKLSVICGKEGLYDFASASALRRGAR
jgi:hypothetical protein